MKQLQQFPKYRACKGGIYSLHDSLQDAAAHADTTPNPGHTLVRGPGPVVKRVPANQRVHEQSAKAIINGDWSRPTLLHGVDVVMRYADPALEALYEMTAGTREMEPSWLACRAVDALTDHIIREWDPKAKHLIMHSSGYDSRLMSKLLMMIYRDRGDEWLGDVKFCCFQPEIIEATDIYTHVGWSLDYWHPIEPMANPLDYYAECLDFETVGKHFSEAERFWGGALKTQLALGDWLDGNVQILSGLRSDESLKWARLNWGTVAWYQACFMWDNPGILPGRGDIPSILPFCSLEWMELLTTYRIPLKIDEFKRLMIEQVDPDLAQLDNWRETECGAMRKRLGGHLSTQEISLMTQACMQLDYQNSWYAQNIGPEEIKVPPVMHYSDEGAANPRYKPPMPPYITNYIKAAIYEGMR